MTEKPVLY